MISKRRFLLGSAALASGQAWAQSGDGAAEPIEVSLQAEPNVVLRPGRPPVQALKLARTGPDAPLRLRRNEPARLRVRNDTAEETGIVICGVRGWGAADAPGTMALQRIAPGQSQSVTVTPPDSGTAWLRAAPSAGNQAQRGAAGLLVIEEPAPPSVDHDVAVLLQDWLLGEEGWVLFGSTPPQGALARTLTVNGRASPDRLVTVPRARVRLRLLNASVERFMLVVCEGATSQVIAIDGQPCDMFVPARDAVPMGPGARFDLMVDLPDAPGREVRLLLRGTERFNGAVEPDQPLLGLATAGVARAPWPPIASLPANPALPRAIALERAQRLDLSFAPGAGGASWTVNGTDANPDPLLRVREGEPVTLGLFNASPKLVPIRIGGHVVRVLHAKDDGWDPYWRDTVLLPPRSRTHVAFVADRPGLWPIESAFDDLLLAGLRCSFAVMPR